MGRCAKLVELRLCPGAHGSWEIPAEVRSFTQDGNTAKIVEQRLSAHFEKEEAYALPQLGLLVPLAEGPFSHNEDLRGLMRF